jgi:predicted ATPase/DNA-binding winged helix-turn-helix (wHTH) protein
MTIHASLSRQHFRRQEEPRLPQSFFGAFSDLDCQADMDHKKSNSATRSDGDGRQVISFGRFRLYPTQRLLLEADKPVRIGSRALDILITLVERPGQLVSKDQLMARVWPGLFVEPANLTVHVAALRRVLGEGREGARYLVNIPGRGYRFVAPVSLADEDVLLRSQHTVSSGKHNLPTQITRLVGRAETVAILAAQLSHARLLTIVGPGGIGKTSVALAVAEEATREYEHGVWLVDLARVIDMQAVLAAVAKVLDFDALSETSIATFVKSLHGKQMLLLFDNCERVVEAAASVAVSILRGAADVRILATSREPLRAEGEHSHRLPSLSIPPNSAPLTAFEALRFSAVELFVERAAARLDDFELIERDVPIVADLCRKLDGNPLAIEFAVGRIDTFGLRGLSTRLDGGLQLLNGGYRTALPRHQTLRAMLDWSFDWLLVPERIVLNRLSIFTAEFSLEAASAVASSDDITSFEVADLVAGLVTKSLVTADIGGKEPQYRLLEITRAYAQEKLKESGEFELVARRHDEYFLNENKRAKAE